MVNFNVLEDNGGGLTLVTFNSAGIVEYLHSGYEYNNGQLADDLKALADGANPAKEWDGNAENPQEDYDSMTSYEYGWKVVADNDGVYPDNMGAPARLELGVTDAE